MKTRTFLLAAALTLASTFAVSGNLKSNTSNEKINSAASYCGVTAQDICKYMSSFDITITNIIPIQGTCNVLTPDTMGKTWIVYIDNGIIIGHETWEG
ncbi:MAG TPA: hypothetical protein VFU15_08395 [Bacteroidia bacterium]|nr:hypothetical protein [Bacteroidia bacterium]